MSREPQGRGDDLFRKSAVGVLWSGAAGTISQLLHLALRLVLARLLIPADFGLVAAALVTVQLLDRFADLKIQPALIQRKDVRQVDMDTAFWSTVGLGIALTLLVAGLAPVLAAFFRMPDLIPIQMALSGAIFLRTLGVTSEAVLVRNHEFRAVGIRRVGAVVVGGSTGIVLAFAGAGAWALVADSLLRAAIGSLLLLIQSPFRPHLAFSRPAFMELWRFSYPLVGANLLRYISRNTDIFLIGRFFTATALGLYNLGYQFVLLPLTYVARAFVEVLLPTISRVQDDPARVRRSLLSGVEVVSFLTFPLMTLLALGAPELVPWIVGEQWTDAVPLVQVLSLAGAVQSVQVTITISFTALGAPRWNLYWNAFETLITTSALLIGLPFGLVGMASGYSIAYVVLTPLLLIVLRRLTDIPVLDSLRSMRGVVISSVLAAGVFVGVDALQRLSAGDRGLLFTLLGIAAAGLAYLAVSAVLSPEVYRLVRRFLERRRPAGGGEQPAAELPE